MVSVRNVITDVITHTPYVTRSLLHDQGTQGRRITIVRRYDVPCCPVRATFSLHAGHSFCGRWSPESSGTWCCSKGREDFVEPEKTIVVPGIAEWSKPQDRACSDS